MLHERKTFALVYPTKKSVRRWIELIGTPSFLYDRRLLLRALSRYREIVGAQTLVSFAMKACYVPEVLRTLRAEGLGVEVMTLEEADYAFSFGWESSRIDFNGVGRDRLLFRLAITRGLHCILASPHEVQEFTEALRQFSDPPEGLSVGLRLRVRAIEPHYRRFGLSLDEAASAARHLKRYGVGVDGVTLHGWNPRLTDRALRETFRSVFQFANRYCPKLWQFNLGGGDPPVRISDPPAWLTRMEQNTDQKIVWKTEPGRPIVNPAALVLTRVLETRSDHVVLDVPGSWLPPLDRVEYEPLPLRVRTGGPRRSIADRLLAFPRLTSRRYCLGNIRPGDTMAIYKCGAYTVNFMSPLGRLIPRIFWVEKDEPRPIDMERFLSWGQRPTEREALQNGC